MMEQDCHEVLLLPDTLAMIFRQLTVPDRCRAAQVCRTWRQANDQPDVWRGTVVRLRPDASIPWECLRRRQIRRIKVLEPKTDGNRGLISVVRGIPDLSCLDLSDYDNVSARVLMKIFKKKLPHLTDLNLDGCGHMNNDVSMLISENMPNLVSVDLTMCFRVTDDALMYISRLRRLRRLVLSYCRHVTDEGIAHLLKPDGLPALEILVLAECCELTNQTLLHLSIGQPSLKKLEIGFNRTCVSLEPGHMNSVRWQDLTFDSQIGDEGLTHLTRSKSKLTSLSLCGSDQLTDEGLNRISRLRELEDLNLAFCVRITGRGLRHLTSLPKLRNLDISFCPLISDEDVTGMGTPKFLTRRDILFN